MGAPTGELARGLYFYNSRYYDPGLGRFTQPDTAPSRPPPQAGEESNPGDPQSLNRYSYAANNPLRYMDPSGHFERDAIYSYILNTECSKNSDCANAMIQQWEKNDEWWNALSDAQAGDSLMTVDDDGNMRFFQFAGEGQKRLDKVSHADDPWGNGAVGMTTLSGLYSGNDWGTVAGLIQLDKRGNIAEVHGMNDFTLWLRRISHGQGLAFSWGFGFVMTGAGSIAAQFGGAFQIIIGIGTLGPITTITGDKIARRNGWKEGDTWLRYSKGGKGFAYWGNIVGRNRQEVTRFSQKTIAVDEGKLRK